ncbi:hypothetical protein [Streptomyces sp. NBC_00009]|uniref:hypothetical protein n=1 Tax=Streptomyces sp. NBC_00009 TaxID=2975620 RepID=UPI0032538AA3
MTDTNGEQHTPDSAVGMQLNQTPAGEGPARGGQPDLASSPAQKKAAARAIEDHIQPETKQAGDAADEETQGVVKAFGPKDGHGWLTSNAMSKAHKAWGDQVQHLMSRLSSEKTALRGSNTTLTGTDAGVGSGVRYSSSLDTF